LFVCNIEYTIKNVITVISSNFTVVKNPLYAEFFNTTYNTIEDINAPAIDAFLFSIFTFSNFFININVSKTPIIPKIS